MDSKKSDVVIIGGGIIGLSCAVALAKSGVKVKLIEKDKVGFGCSYGNAGWLTPCFAMPLPMPGLLLKSIGWLFDSASPLYIKPQMSWFLLQWLMHFLKSMNESQASKAIEVLVLLSQRTLTEFKGLAETDNSELGFQQRGLLMLAETPAGVDSAIDELKRTEKFGVRGKILNPSEILQTEPSLHGDFAGAVHFLDEAHVEPLAAVMSLKKEAQKYGAEIVENCELLDFEASENKIKSIKTTKGQMDSEQFVFALGSWSKQFARSLKLAVPILGGKGYSLIFPKLQKQPQIPLMILEKKIAVTPRENSVRVAGTLELVDQDFSVTSSRVNAIYRGAAKHLQLPSQEHFVEVWRGLRPCTSDGVPMIGRHKKLQNLIMACGHQMLGLQTSLGTGYLVADIFHNRPTAFDLRILDPNRF